MEYKYFKFDGGRYFRTIDEESFQVLNENNFWENDDMIYFLYYDVGVNYQEILDKEIIDKLQVLPVINKEVTK